MKLATNTPVAPATGSVTNQLRDIKPPVEIPDPWIWVWASLALLVVLAVGYWLWRRSRMGSLAHITPTEPAHLRARRKLDEALALIGQPREFCILVSDTIRYYLEERFDFRAPERTTEEFLMELHATTLLTEPQKSKLADFLQRCDLVKFARYEPREQELRDLHESALRLVDETAPPPEAPAANVTDPNAPSTVKAT